jgi:hypothetical protein
VESAILCSALGQCFHTRLERTGGRRSGNIGNGVWKGRYGVGESHIRRYYAQGIDRPEGNPITGSWVAYSLAVCQELFVSILILGPGATGLGRDGFEEMIGS